MAVDAGYGVGRELGPHALDAHLESEQIYINLA